jgi:hypothetical protein
VIESLTLTNIGPAPALHVDWAPRINLITGDNGLGKSFLLDIAWWSLTRTWANQTALPGSKGSASIEYIVGGAIGNPVTVRSEFRRESSTWPLPLARSPKQGIVIYVRVDGGFSVWDPARNYWRADADRPDAYHFSAGDVWEGLDINGTRVCEGLERDWVSWQKGNEPQFRALAAVLARLSPPNEPITPGPPSRIFIGEGRDRPTIRSAGQEVPVAFASSGIRRVLALAYFLVWAWTEHEKAAALLGKEPERRMTILFDEPETHLHPRWQRTILPSLLTAPSIMMEESLSPPQVLLATHSPLVLASVEPIFDDSQDDLIHLRLERGTVILEQGRWTKQGDVTNWLVSEVFDLAQARSVEAERAIEAAEQHMRGEGGDPDAIHGQLMALLPDHDPFWARWIIHLEKGK